MDNYGRKISIFNELRSILMFPFRETVPRSAGSSAEFARGV